MPLSDPKRYRDKNVDWMEFFARARREELAPKVDRALLEEHREDPRGIDTPHSAALQAVLNYVHNQPTPGKTFVYSAVPYKKYLLGTMNVRGHDPVIEHDREFTDEQAAVHALFVRRLINLGLLSVADGEVKK